MEAALRLPLALLLVALASLPVHAQTSLRVLHWNVLHSGSGTDGIRDRARQVEWIVRQRPDVVTLNEVTESAAQDYVSRIRLATGREWFMHHVAAVRGSDGNAVMSRFPFLGTGGRVLTMARSVAQVTLDVEGTPVNVFATHIESGDERAARGEQVQLLLPYMARFATPRIVNGDLNAGPDRDEIKPLFASYVDAWDRAVRNGAASSYPDNPPSRYTRTRGARIDYILVSNEGGLHVAGCDIPDQRDRSNGAVTKTVGTPDDRGVRPSDHNLVVCTLTLASVRPPKDEGRDAPQAADVVLRAVDAEQVQGWTRIEDTEAAGGARLGTADRGVAITVPLATPAAFFDLPFAAEAARPYRLWVRGLAQGAHRLNDSVYVQFSGSVTQQGEPIYRIGTASATTVVLEEFQHAGLSGWAWADNGWDSFGPLIYFATSGPHTLRVQLRQDGVSLDQIVLSPQTYLWTSPGSTKEDRTILRPPLR